MQKGQDTWLAGKTEVRMPQVDEKDSGKMGFSSSLQGGTANGPGKPLPPNEWMLVELSYAGPSGPCAGLNFGLSLSPRVIAFTDLV